MEYIASIDHSKLEDITCHDNAANGTVDNQDDDDEIYFSEEEPLSGDVLECCEEAKDTFPNQTIVANKKCKIFPKSRHYAIVRFGSDYADRAIALPKVICHEDEMIDGDKMISVIGWGQDGWINARRDTSFGSEVEWKATLVWTGMRKPCVMNNAHHDEEQWKSLLKEYHDLGDVDLSMKRVPVPTLKSVANELSASEKSFLEMKDFNSSVATKEMINQLTAPRDYSNMLEDIDVSLRDDELMSDVNSEFLTHSSARNKVIISKNMRCCGVVQKVERDKLTFMPFQLSDASVPKHYHGSYSMSVDKNKVYIKGEWAGMCELKVVVNVGESFNIICDLLIDEENKEKFGDIRIAWNGKMPVLTPENSAILIAKSADSGIVDNNKSLEPIDVSDTAVDGEPQVIKNISGTIKKITPSFICVVPIKIEYQSSDPYPVMNQNIYFSNGKTGASYSDLTQSELQLDSYIKMNITKINGKIMVLSVWQLGAKFPQNDELKALEYAKVIRRKTRMKTSPVTICGTKLEEPTPPSQLSARPHSPSYFRSAELRNCELRRPKLPIQTERMHFSESKSQLCFKPPSQEDKSFSEKTPILPLNFGECVSRRMSKGIMSTKSSLSRSKSVTYEEPLSSSTLSLNSTNKECQNVEQEEANEEKENKAVLFVETNYTQKVLSIIENSFEKSIEKIKSLNDTNEDKGITRQQFLAFAKQIFIDCLLEDLQVSTAALEHTWSSFENLVNQFHILACDEMRSEISSNSNKAGQRKDSSAQTAITGRIFFQDCFIE